ncbi:ABC transporter ATP-binding protein [Candidatus Woesearchaeota archaeon]|jgi:branched-chain amino acid transport system ATP-binding protein|nr:ABC transporter ATP-binding protein [Candidatus Woesearchaeota archaeon]MBT4367984.1 ABC transporter ATP-binding protein [Candidatus Woesearchaeota archaeon]MBT4712472.1 ABC transporter ATP-binding protein [Candidatus Woesearchaeota archaeon]MBT6639385.1 ABC transporter ATP-binding protein [Candidatus Woesearchaeota archaeon]MBT7133557.1 ABC transporter ATP-binding protein [Candidatus Woesearchaeota archaeon]
MLNITNLKSGYNKLEILKGINFQVQPNEIVAIIGPNGAGKSTLLKSIFNLCTISSGKLIFKDKNITKLKTHELISEGISYVPQGRQVFNNLSVKENLEMGAYTMRDKAVIQRNLTDVFTKFPILKEKQDDYAFTLSGGQQQILAIARALIQNPQLLLLDEPSLGLSPKAMKEIFKIIKKINQEGVSIIIVEQNAKQAVELAHTTYILEDGKIALKGDKDILKNKKINDIYFGGR